MQLCNVRAVESARCRLQVETGQEFLEPGVVSKVVIDRIDLQGPNAIVMALNGLVEELRRSRRRNKAFACMENVADAQ